MGSINLFNLVAFSAGHTIKQIKFPALIERRADGRDQGAATCYLTANARPEANRVPTVHAADHGHGGQEKAKSPGKSVGHPTSKHIQTAGLVQ